MTGREKKISWKKWEKRNEREKSKKERNWGRKVKEEREGGKGGCYLYRLWPHTSFKYVGLEAFLSTLILHLMHTLMLLLICFRLILCHCRSCTLHWYPCISVSRSTSRLYIVIFIPNVVIKPTLVRSSKSILHFIANLYWSHVVAIYADVIAIYFVVFL